MFCRQECRALACRSDSALAGSDMAPGLDAGNFSSCMEATRALSTLDPGVGLEKGVRNR